MDLGLDKLIEMFEERFGRRASTCLLFLIAVGVAAFSLHAIFAYFVRPAIVLAKDTVDYFNGAPLAPTKEQVAYFVIQAGGTLLVFCLCYAVISVLLHRACRSADRLHKKLSTTIEHWNDVQKQLEENAYKLVCKYLEERGIEVVPTPPVIDATPSPQSPPNTEGKTPL